MARNGGPHLSGIGDVDRIQELLLQFQPEKVPNSRRIYANRNLRMSGIASVGFDMDYTLAEYHVALEELQVEMTIDRLVRDLGYSPELKQLTYDPSFAIRGLVVDKRFGNLVKMDSHRHISHAYHGLKPLTKEQRRKLYRNERIRMSAQRFALIDTLFAVPEAWLYANVVDLEERTGGRRLKAHRYRAIYDDIREVIDSIHADGSLKAIVTADIAKYIKQDPDLAPMLHQLREGNKHVFLMTNSYGKYTTAVMEFLLDGRRPDCKSWRDYFDIIVVGSKKPAFFVSDAPFKRLDDELQYVDEDVVSFERGVMYEGGNLADFERLAGVSGDNVLYVGDNLYGDILRSKKSSAWRTVMIVPELEREIELREAHADDFVRRNELETHRTQIDAELHQHAKLVKALGQLGRDGKTDTEAIGQALLVARTNARQLERNLHDILERIWKLNNHLAGLFNANWGMVLKARGEHSVFGGQIEDYACAYTSRASNFAAYSPFHYHRTPRDHLPHERRLPVGNEPSAE